MVSDINEKKNNLCPILKMSFISPQFQLINGTIRKIILTANFD